MRRSLALFSVVLLVLLSISGASAAGSNTGTVGSATSSSPEATGSNTGTVGSASEPGLDAPDVTSATMVVTLTPGTAAPPTALGPFTLIPVPKPASGPVAPACTHAIPPLPTPGGPLGVTPNDAAALSRCIGSGWATWSHGYTGDVYYTGGPTSQTLTMPPSTGAFYFYVEPNPFSVQTCSATATSSSGTAATGPISVDGSSGAKFVGFHDTAGTISKIDVSCTTDFATGNYGWAGGTPSGGTLVVTLTPGTAAPPTTLGPFTLIPVPKPASGPVAPACTHAIPPLPTPGGPLGVTPNDAAALSRCIGSGWATWSHGYTGDVYYTGGPTSQTLTMPPSTGAFYFYVEPNPFSVQTCSATATSSSGTAATGPISVDGSSGAKFVGFHDTAGTISKIDVSCTTDFATGEYGWAGGGGGSPLVCDIQLNKTTFVSTDQVIANVQVKNPGTVAVPVEVKIWVALPPPAPPAPFIRIAEFVLIPGFDTGLISLVQFPASAVSKGSYELNCRLLNPVTGSLLAQDLNPFLIQ